MDQPNYRKPCYPHHIAVNEDGRRVLSVFLPGERPIMIDNDNPIYERLLFEVEQGELDPAAIINYVVNA